MDKNASRMLAPTLITAPAKAAAIITVEEIQSHARLDSDFDKDYVGALCLAAMNYLDGYTGALGVTLLTQTWSVSWDTFPWQEWHGQMRSAWYGWPVSDAEVLRLPFWPVSSVSFVKYYDAGNVQQTLSSALYGVYRDARGDFIQLVQGQVWPVTYQRPDAVTVQMVAGYGADAGSVPMPIRHAAKMLVSHWYQNRESVGSSTAEVDALLALYRRSRVH
jgi:uncharacterized phiE125 gp8 family phage protein